MKLENGIGGVFSCPTTAVNTRETSATTIKSVNPVTMAIGKRVKRDFRLSLESFFKSLFVNSKVLLYILTCNHNLY